MGYYSAKEKEWTNVICSHMDATTDYHTKWSKLERQTPYDITFMWNLKYGTNGHLQSRDRLTERRLVVAKGEAGREGADWEFGGARCKLLHLEGINKVLMYSTWNCIQNSVINHHGKEHWKRMCISEHLSQAAVQQRLAHCKSTILQ